MRTKTTEQPNAWVLLVLNNWLSLDATYMPLLFRAEALSRGIDNTQIANRLSHKAAIWLYNQKIF